MPELQAQLTKMLSGVSASELSNAGDSGITLGGLTPAERSRMTELLRKDQGLPEETRAALGDALVRTPSTVAVRPKCSELPGRYLDANHAECWQEFENRRECHWWNVHYHSDQTATWSGRCRGRLAEGRGTLSVSVGSDHHAYEGTGTLAGGRANGRWTESWADGHRFEGEYRDGEVNGWPDYVRSSYSDRTSWERGLPAREGRGPFNVRAGRMPAIPGKRRSGTPAGSG